MFRKNLNKFMNVEFWQLEKLIYEQKVEKVLSYGPTCWRMLARVRTEMDRVLMSVDALRKLKAPEALNLKHNGQQSRLLERPYYLELFPLNDFHLNAFPTHVFCLTSCGIKTTFCFIARFFWISRQAFHATCFPHLTNGPVIILITGHMITLSTTWLFTTILRTVVSCTDLQKIRGCLRALSAEQNPKCFENFISPHVFPVSNSGSLTH